MFYGSGVLEDLLPDVPLPEEVDEQQAGEEDEEEEQEAADEAAGGLLSAAGRRGGAGRDEQQARQTGDGSRSRSSRGASGGVHHTNPPQQGSVQPGPAAPPSLGSASWLLPTSQFPLLEETERQGGPNSSQPSWSAGGAAPEEACLTPASRTVLDIFRARLLPAAAPVGGQSSGCAAAAAAAAPEAVSMFALLREGRLSRHTAAQLFYQVCGKQGGGSYRCNAM